MSNSIHDEAVRVVVIGSANTDLVVTVPGIPRPGETVLGGDLQTLGGGKGANQAVAAARLGANVTFIARVGDDTFGTRTRENLSRENVHLDFLQTTPNTPSGVALIAVNAEGENAIVVAPGANAHLTAADVDAAGSAFDRAQAVVVSLEVPMPAVLRAVEAAHARNVPVILNPAPAQSLPPELLARVSVLTPNETEAAQIAERNAGDETPEEIGETLRARGVANVVITCGAQGAVLVNKEGSETVPGFAVRAVDTVGAGDCFTAGLAVELARGVALPDAIRFANAAAALSVTRNGAQPSLPTRTEVEVFLSERNENRALTMTRPNLTNLPDVPPLTPGLTLRPLAGANEAKLWTQIQRDAEPFFAIADDLFVREFGSEDAQIQTRCFVVIDTATGEAVATASAWHGGDEGARGSGWGRLHWVATRPVYQRRGVARSLVAHCLHTLARLGHEKAYLVTSTGRLGAIDLYEKTGFVRDTP